MSRDGIVQGFALGHRLDGEFGRRHPVVVLDALGVGAGARGHGGAQDLMKQLQSEARARGAHELRSQVSWPNKSLMRFFARAGFKLGARLVLGRPCAKLPGELRPGEGESFGEDLSEDESPFAG